MTQSSPPPPPPPPSTTPKKAEKIEFKHKKHQKMEFVSRLWAVVQLPGWISSINSEICGTPKMQMRGGPFWCFLNQPERGATGCAFPQQSPYFCLPSPLLRGVCQHLRHCLPAICSRLCRALLMQAGGEGIWQNTCSTYFQRTCFRGEAEEKAGVLLTSSCALAPISS